MMDENANTSREPQDDGLQLDFDIPVKGSLGLLALGAAGIKLWRKARRAANQNDQPAIDDIHLDTEGGDA